MGRKIKTYKNRKKTTLRNKHKKTRKKYRTLKKHRTSKKHRRENKKLRGGRPMSGNHPQTKADRLASKISGATDDNNRREVLNKIAECEHNHPSPNRESKPRWMPERLYHHQFELSEYYRGLKLHKCLRNI